MLEDICAQFYFEGELIYAEPYGCGHINDTYAVYFKRAEERPIRYILQRINTRIFNPDELMDNITRVTDYLRKIIIQHNGNPERETLTVVPVKTGGHYYRDEAGGCWRAYIFIEDTITCQNADTAETFFRSGKAFGSFQNLLEGFPARELHETIKHFHDTPDRYRLLCEAITKDICGRAADVADEIRFFTERADEYSVVTELMKSGKIPIRVTHNDTKLNNVLLDPITREGVCVIDLDTIMPGSVLYDFGDSIRFGASTADEDEQDLNQVRLSLPLFQAFTEGFLSETGGTLTEEELNKLAFGAKLMTMECGMRFLTDHLSGDSYFKIHRQGHNLDRARTQIKLAQEIEVNMDTLNSIVRNSIR